MREAATSGDGSLTRGRQRIVPSTSSRMKRRCYGVGANIGDANADGEEGASVGAMARHSLCVAVLHFEEEGVNASAARAAR